MQMQKKNTKSLEIHNNKFSISKYNRDELNTPSPINSDCYTGFPHSHAHALNTY